MDKGDWFLLIAVLILGFCAGFLVAPDPCMVPPGGFAEPFKHPGIGG